MRSVLKERNFDKALGCTVAAHGLGIDARLSFWASAGGLKAFLWGLTSSADGDRNATLAHALCINFVCCQTSNDHHRNFTLTAPSSGLMFLSSVPRKSKHSGQ